MYTQEVTIHSEVGLQARPATFFIQKANEYKSSIWVEKEERRVNAKSLLGVLSMAITTGTEVTLIAEGPDEEAAVKTLAQMLDLYDSLFFSGFLGRAYGEIDVTLSQRLTSSAGKFMYVRGGASRLSQAEIRMSGDFLFRLSEGPFLLNGLSVATPQEAFLVVFEHELCHAAENALFGSTGHSSRFLSLAHGLFGHNDTRHSLPTRMQEAASEGLSPGVRACFCYQGSVLRGIVTYIGKTATVMVEDRSGAYRDRQGRRYSKYSVPLGHLTVSHEK